MSDSESEYVITRKRVGGGYKDVLIKRPPVKTKRKSRKTSDKIAAENEAESEKQDVEVKEKEIEDCVPEIDVQTELHLPLPREELLSRNSCDGKIRYDEYPILKYIQDNVIGHKLIIDGPFGPKRVVYCDYTASGRSLTFIEDYIRDYVLPLYANTHSETGRNARQTQKFREEARSVIRRCVNAGKDDVVIFTGSGSTSGIHKLAWSLKINQPRVAEETVVITGPFEHHSNVLIWKELGTTVVRIKENDQGTADLEMLQKQLKFWKEKKRLVLVSISAASNVTGIITDTEEVARIAHRHGALVAFDYAGGGPYLKIDMNPSKKRYKDAVFISPHKFVGGPGSPGILVAKRWMFKNQIPDRVGGGTVVYVTRDTHAYSSNIEGREEGGTPAIIESIRTGLAFLLKDAVTEHVIMSRDEDLCCRAFAVWEQNPNLIILGSHNAERVTIFSFIVKHAETGKFIHFNFISTLLNDLFGIQSRGGCACAGPYVHDLLGITETMAKRLKWFVDDSQGKHTNASQTQLAIMRPGFVRVNLPFFYDDETVDYIIKAVDMVAKHGWKLLPKYTFEPFTANFKHNRCGPAKQHEDESLFSLQDIDCRSYGKFHINREPPRHSDHVTLEAMLADAETIFRDSLEEIERHANRPSTASHTLKDLLPKDRQKLRWFMTPQEVINYVTGSKRIKQFKPIMTPRIDFREKEWNSAPDSYNRLFGEDTDLLPRAKDDLAFNKDRHALKRQLSRKIEKLPPVHLDNMAENDLRGNQNGLDHVTNHNDHMTYKSITSRESISKRGHRKHAGYESDNEIYLMKDRNGHNENASNLPERRERNQREGKMESDTDDGITDLENTWPKKKGHHSRKRRPNRGNSTLRFRGKHRSLPRGRYDDFRLPEIG